MKRKTIITLLVMAIFAGIAGVAGTAEIAGGQETGGAPASDAERIAALERQVAELRSQVAVLQAKVAVLMRAPSSPTTAAAETPETPESPAKGSGQTAAQETEAEADDGKTITQTELMKTVKEWVKGTDETDAARKAILDRLTGRRVAITGTLINVEESSSRYRQKYRVSLHYVSKALGTKTVMHLNNVGQRVPKKIKIPAETILVIVDTDDDNVVGLKRGSKATAEVTIGGANVPYGEGHPGIDNWQTSGQISWVPLGVTRVTIHGTGKAVRAR